MLKPTMSLKATKVDDTCALITDGRFSGATAGLSIGHVSPEAAAGGAIGLIREGDRIAIDIPARSIVVLVSDAEMEARRSEMEASDAPWHPGDRPREVSAALRVYAAFAESADKGGFRRVP